MTNPEARTLVAAKILECASNGNQTHDLLLDTGRNVDAVRKFFR